MLFYFLNAGDRGMGRMPQLIALACCLMYLSMFAHASISCNCLFADTCVPRVCVCARELAGEIAKSQTSKKSTSIDQTSLNFSIVTTCFCFVTFSYIFRFCQVVMKFLFSH